MRWVFWVPFFRSFFKLRNLARPYGGREHNPLLCDVKRFADVIFFFLFSSNSFFMNNSWYSLRAVGVFVKEISFPYRKHTIWSLTKRGVGKVGWGVGGYECQKCQKWCVGVGIVEGWVVLLICDNCFNMRGGLFETWEYSLFALLIPSFSISFD